MSLLLILYQVKAICGRDISNDYEESIGQIPAIIFHKSERTLLSELKCTSRKIRSTQLGAIDFKVESGVDKTGSRIVPDEFCKFVPKGKSFSFDTIWDVTRMHFLEYKQREEIQQILPFPISTGAISNLYKEGLAYFRTCHEASIADLKKRYRQQGRLFILQIDGTNEGGAWTHFQVRDSVSGNVLLAKRISTENQSDIEAILREVERQFGQPDAVISDMSGRGIAAVENLWDGKVPLFICQFHFLRDIGKDLLGILHNNLRKSFASSRLTSELNALRRNFSKMADNSDEDYLQGIILLDWILDYRSELQGEGIPFDLAWKTYYERCVTANCHIKEILGTTRQVNKSIKILLQIRKKLRRILDNKATTRRYNTLTESTAMFTKIRNIFHVEPTNADAPLSRNATASNNNALLPQELQEQILSIADELKEKSKKLNKKQSERYLKAAKQLEKYKNMLRNYIEVNGNFHSLPRTNNLCEISFREEKRGIRRTNGKKNLARVLDQTPAEIIYLQNLKDPTYCKTVFGARPIHEVFGTISQDAVKKILKTMNTCRSRKMINPVIKQSDFLIINRNYFIKRAG